VLHSPPPAEHIHHMRILTAPIELLLTITIVVLSLIHRHIR
jgi:hypothetical protein